MRSRALVIAVSVQRGRNAILQATALTGTAAQFGQALRDWRGKRRRSQLDLGLSANVSARHISFLETGRARPSRAMVLMLCEALDLPRAERNRLLTAAGFAPLYAARDWSAAEMAPARAAMEHMLTRHAPYPGLALDRHWRLLRLNAPAAALFGAFGIGEGDPLLDAMLDSPAMLDAIENLADLAAHICAPKAPITAATRCWRPTRHGSTRSPAPAVHPWPRCPPSCPPASRLAQRGCRFCPPSRSSAPPRISRCATCASS